ncbi:MAG: RNA-binding protein [Pseudomonadota bacterium]
MAGASKQPQTPTRKCVATGELCDRSGLIRFVISPDGTLTPDILEKLPGRGMWVKATRAALYHAIDKNPFSRAAKQKVGIPDGFADLVESLLLKRLIDLLALGRKSGIAITGYENVKEALVAEQAELLFQASDGSPRQKSKLKPPMGENTYFDCLTQSELGQAFGRDYAIHVATLGGGLTEKIQLEAQKLRGMRVSAHNE